MSEEMRLQCLQLAIATGSSDPVLEAAKYFEFVTVGISKKSAVLKLVGDESSLPASAGDTPHGVIRRLAREYGVSADAIVGRSRKSSIVHVRYQAIQEIGRRFPQMSSVEIANIFNRDHTTIIHALNKPLSAA